MKQNRMPEVVAPLYDMVARLKRLLLDKSYPLSSQLAQQPFFIMGSGRCGSTLLRRMLEANPDIHIPPESYVLGEVGRLFMRNRQMDWHHLVNLVLSTFEYQHEFDKFNIDMRGLVHQLWQLPEHQRSLAEILDALYRYHGKQTGQSFTLWGDKTPKNTFELDMLIRIFPQAKFVHLLRDGVDVAASFVSRGLMDNMLSAAKHWQTSVLISREFMQQYPEQCIEVRYEDLVATPEQALKRLSDFLGLTFHADMVESLKHTQNMGDLNAYAHYEKVLEPVSTRNIGLGRSSLSEQDKLMLQQHIGKTLSHMGYSL
ncbi:MAG: sulfotransferase [Ghiorsea sp.]|nr:sulfotransferase [Ghiorsea sp.]